MELPFHVYFELLIGEENGKWKMEKVFSQQVNTSKLFRFSTNKRNFALVFFLVFGIDKSRIYNYFQKDWIATYT